jgi:hypothetical protein
LKPLIKLLSCPIPSLLQQGGDCLQDAFDSLLFHQLSSRGDGLAEIRQKGDNQLYPNSSDYHDREHDASKNCFVTEELLCQIQQWIVITISFIAIPGAKMIVSEMIGLSVTF